VRPAQRDATLEALATRVLGTDLADRAQRALSLEAGLSDPYARTDRLVALGAHVALQADPVAYGQLVALLAEQPEAQQQVVAAAVAAQPRLADAHVPGPAQAVTAREQQLVATARQQVAAWAEATRALAPEAADAIAQRVEMQAGDRARPQ
jgi:hypothetical protein